MRLKIILGLIVVIPTILLPEICLAYRIRLDFESGPIYSGYNDVKIPGDLGTEFSLSDELQTDTGLSLRIRLTYALSKKHKISVFAAPLELEAHGMLSRPVRFEGVEFPPETSLRANYKFNSYRLTYRFDFYHSEFMEIGLGITAKIRDAAISLEEGDLGSVKANLGFVPLINFRWDWMFTRRIGMILEGDALVAPQGRAEDVLLAVQLKSLNNLAIKIGYRILEGGSDSDEIYNFTMLHYIAAGVILSL
ncbi:hypothetical protein JW877_00860 [bacterium]|nr:hypothetical protein [bacterium]